MQKPLYYSVAFQLAISRFLYFIVIVIGWCFVLFCLVMRIRGEILYTLWLFCYLHQKLYMPTKAFVIQYGEVVII